MTLLRVAILPFISKQKKLINFLKQMGVLYPLTLTCQLDQYHTLLTPSACFSMLKTVFIASLQELSPKKDALALTLSESSIITDICGTLNTFNFAPKLAFGSPHPAQRAQIGDAAGKHDAPHPSPHYAIRRAQDYCC